MKKRFNLIVLAVLFMIPAYSQTPVNDPHWSKIWEDDFNFFNGNIWGCSTGLHNDDTSKIVVSTNRPENVFISNGNLVLQARRENYTYTNKQGITKTYPYTTGGISTGKNHNVHYGYIESRIKLPYGHGFWPAFWTWNGRDFSYTNEGEIDIFEMLGHFPPNIMTTSLHTCYGCPEESGNWYYQEIDISYSYTNWNLYAIEWTPTKFIWYVNGVAVRTSPNPGIVDPVRIILNLGINSDSGYQPNNTTPFPAKMEIDYVRIYKLKCDNNTVITQIPNFNTYNYAVKKSISLGSNTVIPSNSNIILRATDFIELRDGFELPLGSELYLDITPCENTISSKPVESIND
jgi:beta-glucanase (GH16 family)